MKPQSWLTIAGIATSTLLIDLPPSSASISNITIAPEKVAVTVTNGALAYNQFSELVNNLRRYEQNISCDTSGKNLQLTHQTWIDRGISLQQQQKYR